MIPGKSSAAGPFRCTGSRIWSSSWILLTALRTGLRWTALAVIDDTAAALGTDAHRRSWRTWLYWSNLLQFLSRAGADGVQLATSQVSAFPLEVLAVCGGLGELDSLMGAPADSAGTSAAEAALADSIRKDPAWEVNVLPFLGEDERELLALADAARRNGKRAPVCTYELGSGQWVADFAWPDDGVQVAVVAAAGDDDSEAQRRDAAYAAAGWQVRTAADWLASLDSLLALLPDADGTAR